MYFLIAGWGHDNRRYAAMKFFLYTAAGSAFLFAGILSVAFLHQHATGTCSRSTCARSPRGRAAHVSRRHREVCCSSRSRSAFAVKVPLFPFHTWLPDAHTDAPTAGSVVLAGVMLKMGAYGFLRFAIPMFPQAAVDLAPMLLVLAVIGIIYGAIVAAMQPNLKRIVAYSSVAHLGLRRARHLRAHEPGHLRRRCSRCCRTGSPPARCSCSSACSTTAGTPTSSSDVPRHLEGGAGARRPVRRRDVRVDRPARLLRLRRRVPVAARRVPHEPLVRGGRDHRRDPRRGLPAVGGAARVHRRARRARTAATPRHRLPRARARSCRCSACRCSSASTRSRCSTGSQPTVAGARSSTSSRTATTRRRRVPDADRVAATGARSRASDRRRTVDADRARRRSTGSRSRPRSRCSRAALADRAAALARPPRPARARGVAAHRDRAASSPSAVFTGVQWAFVHATTARTRRHRAGMVAVDGFAVFVAVGRARRDAARAAAVGRATCSREHLERPEYFALMLCSATGMMLMASANDLIAVFLSLEILSIALYVLAAFDRRRARVAGGRPQVLRARLVLVGGLPLRRRARLRRDRHDEPHRHRGVPRARSCSCTTACCSLGIALLLVGLGFKVAAAPFHMWTPDVYQGAPTPVTAFMASATKAAAFAALLRIFVGAFPLYSVDWRPIVFGARRALAARRQHRRGRADRREAHARVLVDRARRLRADRRAGRDRQGHERGARSTCCTYALMTIGAFAVVDASSPAAATTATRSPTTAGSRRRRPVLAGLLTLFLLAQAGVPLTGGFVAKLSVFSAAVDVGQYWLALDRHARRGHRRVRLPAHRPRDVRAGRRRGRARRCRASSSTPGRGVALDDRGGRDLFLGVVPGIMLDFATRRHPAPRGLARLRSASRRVGGGLRTRSNWR